MPIVFDLNEIQNAHDLLDGTGMGIFHKKGAPLRKAVTFPFRKLATVIKQRRVPAPAPSPMPLPIPVPGPRTPAPTTAKLPFWRRIGSAFGNALRGTMLAFKGVTADFTGEEPIFTLPGGTGTDVMRAIPDWLQFGTPTGPITGSEFASQIERGQALGGVQRAVGANIMPILLVGGLGVVLVMMMQRRRRGRR